jgi:hypothetical protein
MRNYKTKELEVVNHIKKYLEIIYVFLIYKFKVEFLIEFFIFILKIKIIIYFKEMTI